VEQAVVQNSQPREAAGGHTQQEATERGGLGIARQTGEVLKHAVLPQELCSLDPFEPKDHRVEESEQHLPHAVAVVALEKARLLGQQLPQPQATEEAMQ
jgi:microcompartment protein CcmL/EutN